MTALYPVVPLAQRQALGIAIMSYDGSLGFGLLADYDALGDLEELAEDLRAGIAALAQAAAPERGRAEGGSPARVPRFLGRGAARRRELRLGPRAPGHAGA
jgi:hypothetical protein